MGTRMPRPRLTDRCLPSLPWAREQEPWPILPVVMNQVDQEGAKPMTASRVRVAARRSVVDAQAERRRQRQEREDQIAALAIEVNVTLASGRAALNKAEVAAGMALAQMLAMGMSVGEVVEWCASDLTVKDVSRLRRIADTAADQHEPDEKAVAK